MQTRSKGWPNWIFDIISNRTFISKEPSSDQYGTFLLEEMRSQVNFYMVAALIALRDLIPRPPSLIGVQTRFQGTITSFLFRNITWLDEVSNISIQKLDQTSLATWCLRVSWCSLLVLVFMCPSLLVVVPLYECELLLTFKRVCFSDDFKFGV